jgi:hypothetical protein
MLSATTSAAGFGLDRPNDLFDGQIRAEIVAADAFAGGQEGQEQDAELMAFAAERGEDDRTAFGALGEDADHGADEMAEI